MASSSDVSQLSTLSSASIQHDHPSVFSQRKTTDTSHENLIDRFDCYDCRFWSFNLESINDQWIGLFRIDSVMQRDSLVRHLLAFLTD